MSESSLEDIKGLSELTNLRELILSGGCMTVERCGALESSIGMLRDLRYLSLFFENESVCSDSPLDSLLDPPLRLEVLDLERWTLNRVPRRMGELCCLRILGLRVLHLSSDEARVLGELPSLLYARFEVLDVSQDKVVVSSGLFPVLYGFWFCSDEDVTACVSFEAGAMPKLQTLTLGFGWKEWMCATTVGMECLPSLQDIRLWSRGNNAGSNTNRDDVHAAIESAFRRAASVHSRHPSVTIW
jgi:hypothetical protein